MHTDRQRLGFFLLYAAAQRVQLTLVVSMEATIPVGHKCESRMRSSKLPRRMLATWRRPVGVGEKAWTPKSDFGVDCRLVGVEVGAEHERRVRVGRWLLELVVVRGGGGTARSLWPHGRSTARRQRRPATGRQHVQTALSRLLGRRRRQTSTTMIGGSGRQGQAKQ